MGKSIIVALLLLLVSCGAPLVAVSTVTVVLVNEASVQATATVGKSSP